MQARSMPRLLARPLRPSQMFRRYLERQLAMFRVGNLRIELPNGETFHHGGEEPGVSAHIRIERWRLLRKLLLEGEIGLARGYVDGDWSTNNLRAVLDFGLQNVEAVTAATRGLTIAHLYNRIGHRRNANTRNGSQRNIAAHYDLGNAFYERWLDRDMMYSSAVFENDDESLEVAQRRKLDRVVELADLRAGDHVIEIGCGWGALARRMAETGASVTGISLSVEQIAYARGMLEQTPAGDRVAIHRRDYRDLTDQYDRAVSIEMFEAVGEKYWPVYFDKLKSSLRADGVAVLQIITIAENLFESYRSRPDFIQQYIFPGGMLPTVAMVREQAERAGFRLEHHEAFGPSYARTLQHWRERFHAAWP
ncbi:MAG: cyclopropane-fatty-acyl-phospholipid synthase family protein, partial [Alphaproteobacteria bacterium]|nr:cyclopropane-fatty-acyl-phospholipid synthase family protein [Alphaproteobacteria bacterium]